MKRWIAALFCAVLFLVSASHGFAHSEDISTDCGICQTFDAAHPVPDTPKILVFPPNGSLLLESGLSLVHFSGSSLHSVRAPPLGL